MEAVKKYSLGRSNVRCKMSTNSIAVIVRADYAQISDSPQHARNRISKPFEDRIWTT